MTICRPRVPRHLLASLLALGAFLLIAAPSVASAANTRNFDTQITGQTPPGASAQGPFGEVEALTVDGANNLWVSDFSARSGRRVRFSGRLRLPTDWWGSFQVRRKASQPRRRRLHRQPLRRRHFLGNHIALSYVDVFDEAGAFTARFEHGFYQYELNLAIDNSGGSGGPGEGEQGRIYVGSNGVVSAFKPGFIGEHDFEFIPGLGEYDYISGDQITGTPAGPFVKGELHLAVDSDGDLYVIDPHRKGGRRRVQAQRRIRPRIHRRRSARRL